MSQVQNATGYGPRTDIPGRYGRLLLMEMRESTSNGKLNSLATCDCKS